MVYVDTEAVFRCELTSAVFGGWLVNGTDSRELSEEIVSGDIRGFHLTLTITARAQYNNTVVQCVTQELGGTGMERSDNVTLRIQGTAIMHSIVSVISLILT